ncbi:unnamed protein product [Lampetra planeri]
MSTKASIRTGAEPHSDFEQRLPATGQGVQTHAAAPPRAKRNPLRRSRPEGSILTLSRFRIRTVAGARPVPSEPPEREAHGEGGRISTARRGGVATGGVRGTYDGDF